MRTLSAIEQYAIVTGSYWAFTLTDGALRMLVLLYFYELGYSPLALAMLFVFYEAFGVITNVFGGWAGARFGLNHTMNIGLGLQILALGMLTLPPEWLTMVWVMVAQALSGIAKDLNKMSAKSAIKGLAMDESGQLYRWIAALTGSKNALKGAGFFLGAVLLQWHGFTQTIWLLMSLIAAALIIAWVCLPADLAKANVKPKFTQALSTSTAVNRLSAARFFLFGARDIWFVIALPVYLQTTLDWSHMQVGAFMALWIIAYGIVQGSTPILTRHLQSHRKPANPSQQTATQLAWALALLPAAIAMGLWAPLSAQTVIVVGLVLFGILFAFNSAVHSYLIVSIAQADGVSKDVGFYYMANAAGRLVGTLLSGWIFQVFGLEWTLIGASLMVVASAWIIRSLPHSP